MIATIYQKLKTDLESIAEIGGVYDYPETAPKEFPAIVFYPSSLNNQYATQTQNRKSLTFVAFITHEAKHFGLARTWNEVMPQSVDAVIAKLDAEWDGGVKDGSRVWYTLDSGDWFMTPNTNNNQLVVAQLFINIQYQNNI